MNTVIVIASIIGIIFVVSKFLRKVKKHTAAMNALVAKATLSTLPIELQRMVIGNAVHVLIKGSHCSFERAAEWISEMDEKSKYGIYAISMMELGVEPISKKWEWQIVSNPFVALINADRQIKMAQLGLKSEGIEVSFG